MDIGIGKEELEIYNKDKNKSVILETITSVNNKTHKKQKLVFNTPGGLREIYNLVDVTHVLKGDILFIEVREKFNDGKYCNLYYYMDFDGNIISPAWTDLIDRFFTMRDSIKVYETAPSSDTIDTEFKKAYDDSIQAITNIIDHMDSDIYGRYQEVAYEKALKKIREEKQDN